MPQASCPAGLRWEKEPFLPATLKFVGRCPARSDYIELRFATPDGLWKWCFPDPGERRKERGGPLALKLGRWGTQAHLITEDGLGFALLSASALPMILAGAEVYVEGRLAAAGF
jgi:hypothetical protein